MEGENITITLTKYPTDNRINFEKLVAKYYSEYRKNYLKTTNNGTNTTYLLRPLVYHLFSNYDAAIICITQSEKIAQRLFTEYSEHSYLNTNYQIQTGEIIKIDKEFNLQEYFSEISSFSSSDHNTNVTKDNILLIGNYDFTIISNLAVNKGLKIGLGLELFNRLYKKIDQILNTKNSHYLLTKSNSWFDISMTIFGANHNVIFDKILKIRQLRLIDIWPEFETDNYNCLYTNYYNRKLVSNAHIFIESSSSFGVEYSKLKDDKIPDGYNLNTLVEWKVKSGHEVDFAFGIKDLKMFSQKIDYLNGKMDFLVYEKNSTIKTNKTIFKALRNSDSNLSRITKQIRTNVLIDYRKYIGTKKAYNKKLETTIEILDFTSKLEQLTYKPESITKIDIKLKSLKVSRHIREKIKKCFSIANSGLTDNVLFEFYIEFIPWLNRLSHSIFDDLENIVQLIDIERILLHYIEVFDNAYRDRAFNTYLFEDIHDLSIQYNASLIQLVSAYNSCLHILTRDYFNKEPRSTRLPRFLVNINLNNTVSNDNSVNFHIHDITAPELLLVSLHKELFNFYIKNTGYSSNGSTLIKSIHIEQFSDNIEKNISGRTSNKLSDSSLDRYNILNDSIRLLVTYNWNFELYAFWLWSFNVQNTQLYNADGFVNEENFKHEIIRFIAVKIIAGYTEDYECPIPELFFYWDRYYNNIQKAIKEELSHEKIIMIKNEIFTECGLINEEINIPHFVDLAKTNGLDILRLPFSATNRILKFSSLVSFCEGECQGSLIKMYSKLKGSSFSLRNTLEFFIFYYLWKLKVEQKSEISILRRNLDTGQPMKSFIKFGKDRNTFYMLDPQGGTFLCDQKYLEKYFTIKKDIIRILWDISLRWKLEYLLEKTN